MSCSRGISWCHQMLMDGFGWPSYKLRTTYAKPACQSRRTGKKRPKNRPNLAKLKSRRLRGHCSQKSCKCERDLTHSSLVPLSVRHLLVECPSLRELREQYLAQCRGRDGSFFLSLVLGEKALSPGHEVLKFLEESGFLHLL